MSDFLICYDITAPKRLNRIHRRISQWAMPIQYSVFLFSGDSRLLQRHLTNLANMIDTHTDDLRCYPLPANGKRLRLGRPTLPAGILLDSLPTIEPFGSG